MNASFNRPTGEGLLRPDAAGGAFSVLDRAEFVEAGIVGALSVVVNGEESSVSVVMRGEEAVKYPICDWCGVSVGLLES